jgi:nitrile hydratase subunit beta
MDTFFAVDDGAGQLPVVTSSPTTMTTTTKPGALGMHDVGGVESLLGQKVLQEQQHELAQWELQTHALLVLLVSKRLLTVDELRRGVEYLPADTYCHWGYYDKWAASIATCLLERGVIACLNRLITVALHFSLV